MDSACFIMMQTCNSKTKAKIHEKGFEKVKRREFNSEYLGHGFCILFRRIEYKTTSVEFR